VPTGGAALSAQEQDVVFGFVAPDLSVRANRLGEGLNLGASVGYAHPLNPDATAGLTLAFVHRGPYDTSTPSSVSEFELDPGYEARAAAALDLNVNGTSVHVGATVTAFGEEKVNGNQVYRIGPQLVVDISGSRDFMMGRGFVAAAVTAIGRAANSVPANGDLVTEEFNTSNNQLLVEIGSGYVIAPGWSLSGRILGRYVVPNDNDVGEARVLEAGVTGSYAVSSRLAISTGGRVIVGDGTSFAGFDRSIFGLEALVRASIRL
jgi:hypothetical protein